MGTKLTKMLTDKKHEVVILSRNPKNKNEFKWDISNNYIDSKAFENTEYIVHLAGAGIADKRWSKERKKVIIDSRVETANLLFNSIKENNIKLKGFISASGIGYYGAITSDKIFTESDKAGNDFISKVCILWETAAHQFESLQIPVTILRTGIVLSEKGGALQKMITPIISPLGSGDQYIPWIHIKDLCEMYIKAIEDNFTGVFNAVAPEHNTNKTFSKALAKSTKKLYIGIPVPSFILKLILGKMSKILIEGSRVSTKKTEKSGYSFRFETLNKALDNLFVS